MIRSIDMKHIILPALLAGLFCIQTTTTTAQGRDFLGAGAEVAESFDWSSSSTVTDLAWVQNANQSWALPGTTQVGWYAGFSGDPSSFMIGNGTSNNGGGVLSNFFYTSGDTDRSLGGRPTGSRGPLIIALRLTNVSGQTLSEFTISYAVEVTRQRDAAVNNTMAFAYSLDADEADWRGGGFIEPGPEFNATTPLIPASSNVNGNADANRTVVDGQTVTGIKWEPGTDLWLRWTTPNVASGPNIGLDDVAFTVAGGEATPPVAPTGLAVTPVADTRLELSWVDNSSDETGFRIDRKVDDGSFAPLRTLPANLTFYRDTGLEPDTTYTYRVVAVKDDLESGPSNEASWDVQLLPPAAPARFTAEPVSWTSILLTWERADYNGKGFELERNAGNGWESLAMLDDITRDRFTDSPLPEDTSFSYRIRAYNDQGPSEWVEVPEVRTPVNDLGVAYGADPIPGSGIDITLHVDPVEGNDESGTGEAQSPFRSIGKTIEVAKGHNAGGRGVRILLAPGTYLEGDPNRDVDFGAVVLSGYWTTEAPLIIEGAGWEPGTNTGNVIVTGAEDWTAWSEKDARGVQSKEWPYDWGLNPRAQGPAPEVIKRFELLWVREPGNGWRNYIQVLGPDHDAVLNNLSPQDGIFWVDEDADRIYVRPPEPVDLNNPETITRVTTRKRLIHHWRPQLSTSKTPLAIRNVIFEHSGAIALYLQNVRHITVEDCVFRRNKVDGFSNGSSGDVHWTLRNSRFHDNGVSGWTGGGNYLLAENLEIHSNGRLAYLSNYTGWANEGMKIAFTRSSVLRDWKVWDNWGVGIWLDTGVYQTEISGMTVWNNRSSGIFIENNNRHNIPGLGETTSVLVRDSLFFGNTSDDTTLLGRGLAMAESENVRFDNVVSVNNEHQLAISNNVRGENPDTILSNSLLGSDTVAINSLFLPRNGLGDWQDFFDTLDAGTNDNVYVINLSSAFTGRNGEPITFSEWQNAQYDNPFNLKADKAVDSRSRFIQADYDGRPLVNIFPAAGALLEGEENAPAFIVYRLGPDLSAPFTVSLEPVVSGGSFDPNAPGQLDSPFPGSVVIPAGETRAVIELSPTDDGLVEGRRVLAVGISAAGNAYVTHPEADVLILDANIGPGVNEVYLESAGTFSEGDDSLEIRAVRIGSLEEALSVDLAFGGDALPEADFTSSGTTIRFAAGEETASVTVVPVDDAIAEMNELLEVSLVPSPENEYIPVSPSVLTINLTDNDTAVLETLERPAAAGESRIVLPLKLSNPTGGPVTFSLRWPAGEWIAVDSRDNNLPYGWVAVGRPENRLGFEWNRIDDDGYTLPLELGFSVDYYGNAFDTVTVNSNGFFTFGPLENFFRRYGIPLKLPSTSPNSAPNMAAVFWDDFSHAGGAGTYFETSPDRAVISWEDLVRPVDRLMSFQAVIKPAGVIKFQYKTVNVSPTPSVGIQNGDRTEGLSMAFGEPYAEEGFAVALVPNHAWISPPGFPVTLQPDETLTVSLRVDASALEPGSYVQAFEIVPDSPDLAVQSGSVALSVSGDWMIPGAGWMHLGWFGWVYAYGNGFLEHPAHGTLYSNPGSPASIYLYDFELGWLWTSASAYPFLYRYETGDWLFYLVPSSAPRWFWDSASGDWISFP